MISSRDKCQVRQPCMAWGLIVGVVQWLDLPRTTRFFVQCLKFWCLISKTWTIRSKSYRHMSSKDAPLTIRDQDRRCCDSCDGRDKLFFAESWLMTIPRCMVSIILIYNYMLFFEFCRSDKPNRSLSMSLFWKSFIQVPNGNTFCAWVHVTYSPRLQTQKMQSTWKSYCRVETDKRWALKFLSLIGKDVVYNQDSVGNGLRRSGIILRKKPVRAELEY